MKFLYPQFLWALLAIGIPILIHLFNFRRFQRVYFSNVSLLKSVELQTQKRSKLRHLLVLLTRILAIICLVLAFAQPYFPKKYENKQVGQKHVSVYLDNSFSMQADSKDGELLYLAKQQAIALANQYKPSDEFQLLTNDFEGKHQRFVSREEFISLVEEVKPSPFVKSMDEVYSKQVDLAKNYDNASKVMYWLSDFQKSTFSSETKAVDTSLVVNAIQFVSNTATNVYIDSVWFESPVRQLNKEDNIKVKLRNVGDENLQVRLSLTVNGQIKSFTNVLIEGNQSVVSDLAYVEKTPGLKELALSIGEYPNATIDHDDAYFYSFVLDESAAVLSINPDDTYESPSKGNINQLLVEDSYFKLDNVAYTKVNYASLSKYKLIILHNLNSISSGLQSELEKFIGSGGSVLVFPGEEVNTSEINAFLSRVNSGSIGTKQNEKIGVTSLNSKSEIYQNVFEKEPKQIDLPQIFQYYPLSIPSSAKVENVLTLSNKQPFLATFSYGNGKLYWCASPLQEEATNFGKHSLFVPTLLRIAESSGEQRRGAYVLNQEAINIKDENYTPENLLIKQNNSTYTFIPETQRGRGELGLFMNDQVKEAGNYIVTYLEKDITGFGLNYDRKESDIQVWETEELQAKMENMGVFLGTVSSKNEIENNPTQIGTPKVWKVLILLALLFLLAEVLFLRWLK